MAATNRNRTRTADWRNSGRFALSPNCANLTSMGETWLTWDSAQLAPAANMAWDEALLDASASLPGPVLRFYGWAEPAATFGYSQHYSDIAAWTDLRPLVRRPTGGGLVPHDRDWTYSLAVPPSHEWHGIPATVSYERIHSWLSRAFARIGVETQLAPVADPSGPGQCFIGAERSDLLWRGRKIAGAAQRRNRRGLLIQGSVQPVPSGIVRADWQAAMLAEANRNWDVEWLDLDFRPISALAGALAVEKYSSDAYNRKR